MAKTDIDDSLSELQNLSTSISGYRNGYRIDFASSLDDVTTFLNNLNDVIGGVEAGIEQIIDLENTIEELERKITELEELPNG